jgi:hypothetical protein
VTSVPAPAQPHIAAVVAMLEAALLINVYNGRRGDGDTTCVVVRGTPNVPFGSLGDRYADANVLFQVTAVGVGEEQATAYADEVQAVLLTDARPSVPGRVAWPVQFVASQPVIRDDSVMPPLYIATAQYSIKSNPA